MTSSILSANYNTILFEFGVILVTSKILYALLRKVYQPRIFSDLLVSATTYYCIDALIHHKHLGSHHAIDNSSIYPSSLLLLLH